VVAILLALAGPAAAQSFPAPAAWVPLTCGNGPMIDAANDTPGATGPLDLVGTTVSPAGFHAADAQFLYLRMRVAGDPRQGARLMPNAWGYEFDLDGNLSTYELLISVSGIGNTDQVAIFRHPTTMTPNSAADPAQLPPAFTYPASTHAQVMTAGTSLGGGTDFLIDLAVPWTDLAAVGVQRDTPVYVWAGSSTVANALDLDLACVGGAGAQLSTIGVGLTTPDPAATPGGGVDGGTGGTGPRTLEGGPGCSVGGAAGNAWLALAVLALVGLRRRRSLFRKVN
jgi:MYXO-CTERM domain-containing protein